MALKIWSPYSKRKLTMFQLSTLFLVVAVISGFLGFVVLEADQVDQAQLVSMVALSLFAICGLVWLFVLPWSAIKPPAILLADQKRAPG